MHKYNLQPTIDLKTSLQRNSEIAQKEKNVVKN